ncbi:1-(5-phosphoribosyl)-5-[(5-phosphoribosylamino)methylideneamino] imidazole-4-carboxamide isomerase [Sphingomonas piscis]|uniref:1-(5-phosphoribosyl)-5-[(5-phosphoribosylamino)methylideneamino] imidazole-4-carboxamide isomerase n=1 Tax=Sphingomonas piscis TaxID=2714943 RepID=A0A6G7YLS6_9SPHN|nr:1-(5-phosphoribosyl)-5-[(5-phosphoribosylamino)methylideneamino] imidazole-4-carboxamide isomerase [Sphingomonas piscis]QIK77700.1 1-(5-phosphoribosyl)-5-[(5-phosphoribosylamino)methylideneamino] imidazole-4-carboxamide isomerase [Sphingomonas piscis]
MIIYPAIDLMGGNVVRLRQGRFDDSTRYETAPADALKDFAAAGAQWVHMVDLDGTRAGAPVQHELLAALASCSQVELQVAGGFRTTEHVARMLEAGVRRVVIGSLTVKQPDLVEAMITEFGADRIALALDVNVKDGTPYVAISGWTEDSGRSLWDVAARFPDARHLLLTDIGRDGMLEGPNFELLEEAGRRLPHLAIQASGGVSSVDDLRRLNTAGAVVGKALWEGRVDLKEALSLAIA